MLIVRKVMENGIPLKTVHIIMIVLTELRGMNMIRKDEQLPAISTSIGVAFGHSENSVDSLIKHADNALYRVKERGHRGCCFYEG